MTAREALIRELIEGRCLKTPVLIEAFHDIDRKDFVPKEFEREAYGNYPLPIGFGQTISQPLTVAFMLELLAPKPGDRVLEIGAGSGWVTTLLSCLVGAAPRGKVIGIERIPELKEMAEANVMRYSYIKKGVATIVLGDGAKGHAAHAPFDKIIAAATSGAVRVAWKEQLRPGGRIVAPIKNAIHVLDKLSATDFNMKEYHGFSFVPLIVEEGGNGG